jgi:kinetochore protein NDC80
MESDKDNAAIDLAKFENIIEQMEIEISKYERMIQEKEKQIQETALELERNSLRQKEVQKEISKQAITAEDVARLGKEERRLADLLQRLADQDDQVKTMLWQCDQESSHALESIEEHVSHFNSLACEMQMVPSSAKFAFGIDLELSVVDSDSCVLNKDIKFLSVSFSQSSCLITQTKLREIHGKINEMVLGTNEENHAIEQSLKTVEQDIQLGTDGLESLMQSRQQAEQAFVEEQTALNKQVNDGLARVEAMELDLVKNSNKFSDQVQDLEETAQQLKKDLQSFSSMNLDQEKDLMNQISITAENMFERRMSIAGHVKALHATVKSVYDKVVGDGDSEKVLKFLKVDDDAIPQTTITVNIADLGANEETRVLLR